MRSAPRRIVKRKRVYTPPKLPKSPVFFRPKSYGLTKRKWQIIPRFIITNYGGRYMARKRSKWWVLDMEEGTIARGSEQAGYPSKSEARATAVKFREKYGVWTRIPF